MPSAMAVEANTPIMVSLATGLSLDPGEEQGEHHSQQYRAPGGVHQAAQGADGDAG